MIYALDTNILLLDAHNLYTIGNKNDIIVIPETVLDEIDSKKSGLGEIAYQAREFGRIMTTGKLVDTLIYDNKMTVVEYKIKDKTIHIVSLNEYPTYSGMERNVISDRKIIECTLEYDKLHIATIYHNSVAFLTNDIACGIRAQSLGLNTQQLKDISDTEVAYLKEIEVEDDETFRTIHSKKVEDIDSTYTKGAYNYILRNANSNQIKLATVNRNGTLNVLGKETEQELRKQEVQPRNTGQLFMSKAIQDPSNNLVVVEAKAGSGKTLMALSNAIKLVKINSPYNGIIYIRGSVDDVEDVEAVGFLKGSAEEKNAIYFHPLIDSLTHIAKARMGNSKLKGKQLEEAIETTTDKIIEDCGIQMLTGLGLRGRTLEDAVIVIDEAQNFSKASMRKVLTRFGKNCKVIVIGSQRQIDNAYITKFNNGLSVLLDAATKEQSIGIHVVPLDKVVRSDFAEFAENVFEGK